MYKQATSWSVHELVTGNWYRRIQHSFTPNHGSPSACRVELHGGGAEDGQGEVWGMSHVGSATPESDRVNASYLLVQYAAYYQGHARQSIGCQRQRDTTTCHAFHVPWKPLSSICQLFVLTFFFLLFWQPPVETLFRVFEHTGSLYFFSLIYPYKHTSQKSKTQFHYLPIF